VKDDVKKAFGGKVKVAFGKRVRQLRIEKNLSQEKLAEQCSFHRNYIGMIERGERNVSLENIAVLAKTFRLSLKDLFDY
jgi:transcriptional regulator with XRE-family HTH domain